ncbi:MAG: UDP-N-acetylmuramoyl-tripeptide--D-alanyl-D-alanine ligase [Clostridium sp.]|jgi:UDP-N-acetylmuramoyl-tripeptide--D-alanyl-D-alanine ligase|nr:UDP-N-acetylmuramoyl-tripeptide--D-alanyl-D-alanine ligase [Clostridium sp.]
MLKYLSDGFLFLGAACGLLGTALAFLRSMQIFQLNGYKARTQCKWLRKNPAKQWTQIAAAVLLALNVAIGAAAGKELVGASVPYWALGALAVFLLLLPLFNRPNRAAKKPLVYTPRVIRMLVTAGLAYTLPLILCALRGGFPAAFFAGTCLYILIQLFPLLANLINMPVEALIRRGFVKDAQKKLLACPDLEIIGITGSYGKTSVKYYLTELLAGSFNTLMTPESYNTPMGISKTVREELRGSHEVFVCEMGARYKGDIQELCDFVRPKHGIITAIGEQHLETFKTPQVILHEKLALARCVTNGFLFVNGDNAKLRENRPANAVTYGLGEDNDCYAYDIAVTTRGTSFSVSLNGEKIEGLFTPLIGAHSVCNLVGAIAMARALGVEESEIRARLKRLAPPPHRLAMSRSGGVAIIDDAYNSNPAGAKAALDTLALFDGCKILITPGMVELGPAQYDANFSLGRQAAAVCDYVFAVGERQAPPIIAGLDAEEYPKDRRFVSSSFKEALEMAYALPCAGEKIILLENDLPDNY